MGESEMKMDEQHAGSPTIRIEDKKNDITDVVVGGNPAIDDATTAIEVIEEIEEPTDDVAVNGETTNENELVDAIVKDQVAADLIETETEAETETIEAEEADAEVLEAETETEGQIEVESQEETNDKEPQPSDEPSTEEIFTQEDAVDEFLAGDSKLVEEDAEMPHVENIEENDDIEFKNDKNVVEFESIETEQDEVENENDDEEDNAEVQDELHDNQQDIDEKNENIHDEDEEEAEELEGKEQATSSSILEGALKNGNNDSTENLNKIHMEDVREGCDSAQPSSPGHAEQRSELASETASNCEDGASQTQDSIKIEIDCSDDEKEKSPKRKNQDDDDVDEPAKKLKKEIQQECYLRNKILMEYTEALDMSNFEQIQNEEEKLIVEIQNLNEIAKEKERQWNNIIHMRKMKEELLLRIQRQKQVCLMTNGLENSDSESSSNQQDATSNGQRLHLLQKHSKQQAQNLAKSVQHNLDMNGHDPNKGRNKGTVRNVKSLIADFRQQHPETVPRRGRRIRNVNGTTTETNGNGKTFLTSSGTISFANMALASGAQVRPVDPNSEIAMLLSSMENANQEVQKDYQDSSACKEFLDQITHCERKKTSTSLLKQQQSPTLVTTQYPEVTVHAVTSSSTTSNAPTNSLLHGILTKTQVKTESRTTFSPTLARLLTAPDKAHGAQANKSSNVSISDILSTNKARSEITITPVSNDYEDAHTKRKHQLEEETEDSVDRLVIDESNELGDSRTDNASDAGDEVPQCQGCNQKAAQFVCAGCGNQWYCSRECQVTAWDEHSDVCSG